MNMEKGVEKPEVSPTCEGQKKLELPDDSGIRPREYKLPDDSGNQVQESTVAKTEDSKERELPPKMDEVKIVFKYPEGANEEQKKEFRRQLKAQEKGLNRQSVAENMENRAKYQERKNESGNGRAPESYNAQKELRAKAEAQRIATNQKNGMSYSEAKAEAAAWLETQAALHDPDQIAGGDPTKVSRMGDRSINSSIGKQWGTRVDVLNDAVERFAQNYSKDDLSKIKMNVKLEVE